VHVCLYVVGVVCCCVEVSVHVYLYVVGVVCCQVEVSVMSWSLIQRSPTDWCVVHDLEILWMRRPWPTLGCSTTGKQIITIHHTLVFVESDSCTEVTT
jgi:hypothetical protein